MKDKREELEFDFYLYKMIKNGSKFAEKKFYELYYKEIDNMITKRLSLLNKIELLYDLRQHVWEAIINSLRKGNYRELGPLNYFIYGIVKNTVFKYSKLYLNKWDYQLDSQMIDIVSYKNYSAEVEKSELANEKIIKSILNKLPKKKKKVFELYYINSLTYKEISKLLNISEPTARGHIFSALKLIRNKLKIVEK